MKTNKNLIIVDQIRYHSVDVETKKGKVLKINHPAYIFMKINREYVFVTLTHSSIVKDKMVFKLNNNPNHLDLKKSYWVAEIKIDFKENFSRMHKNMNLDKQDIDEIINYFEQWMKKR